MCKCISPHPLTIGSGTFRKSWHVRYSVAIAGKADTPSRRESRRMTKNGHWLESATVKPEPAEILQSGSSPSDPQGGVARRDATRAASSAIRRSRPRILKTALGARFASAQAIRSSAQPRYNRHRPTLRHSRLLASRSGEGK